MPFGVCQGEEGEEGEERKDVLSREVRCTHDEAVLLCSRREGALLVFFFFARQQSFWERKDHGGRGAL